MINSKLKIIIGAPVQFFVFFLTFECKSRRFYRFERHIFYFKRFLFRLVPRKIRVPEKYYLGARKSWYYIWVLKYMNLYFYSQRRRHALWARESVICLAQVNDTLIIPINYFARLCEAATRKTTTSIGNNTASIEWKKCSSTNIGNVLARK